MAESIVRHHGYKTGLFTSPHLVTVRERIKINGKAISEEMFVKYFWECWDKLQATRSERWPLMPGWFRYLTLLAFKVFQEEAVECAVVEVGMGGRGDSTNILTVPAACGITLLDYDHTEVLGNTLTEIAGQKAGVFKKGVPAVTVPQTEEALRTLREHALSSQTPLYLADSTLETFTSMTPSDIVHGDLSLGLTATFLKTNAVLAVSLTEMWLSKWHPERNTQTIPKHVVTPLSDAIAKYSPHALHPSTVDGLRQYHWPGRAQIHQIPSSPIRLFLDGAHTQESVRACVEWFQQHTDSSRNTSHAILFNCNKPRDPKVLLTPIVAAIAMGTLKADLLYFTMSQVAPEFRKDPSNDIAYSAHTQTTWQHEMAGMWAELVSRVNGSSNNNQANADPFEADIGHAVAIPSSPSHVDVSYLDQLGKALASSPSSSLHSGKTIVWPQVKIVATVNEAMKQIEDWVESVELGPKRVDVLATGSLYLVGAMLEYLDYPTE